MLGEHRAEFNLARPGRAVGLTPFAAFEFSLSHGRARAVARDIENRNGRRGGWLAGQPGFAVGANVLHDPLNLAFVELDAAVFSQVATGRAVRPLGGRPANQPGQRRRRAALQSQPGIGGTMAAVLAVIVIAQQSHLPKERRDPERTASVTPAQRQRLVAGVQLIHPLLEQLSENARARLQEALAKDFLHGEQRRRQRSQQGVECYLEFFGERLV